MILPYSGCFTRRSTRTTTVLSALSDTTVPVRTRLGIFTYSPYAFAVSARARSFCSVRMRAMVRRTSRTRLGFSSWLVADWKRRLNCSRFSSASCCCSWSSVLTLRSSIAAILLVLFDQILAKARDHLGLDRQLLGGALERGLGQVAGDSVELEQDPAGLHPGHPELRAALARAHADFGGLGAH